LRLRHVSFGELLAMVMDGAIGDALTVATVLKAAALARAAACPSRSRD